MKPVLLNAGPVVALLDPADAAHAFVCESMRGMTSRLQIITTGPVVTEVMFQLQDSPGGPQRTAAFFDDARIRIEDGFSPAELHAAADLMDKYADVPMDFADATLVLQATRHRTGEILTLDQRGFRTYRFLRHQPFHLLLQDGSPAA